MIPFELNLGMLYVIWKLKQTHFSVLSDHQLCVKGKQSRQGEILCFGYLLLI